MASFVILDEGVPHQCDVEIDDDGVWLDPADVESVLAWQLKPEGLCRGDVCIPTRPGLLVDDRLSLEAVAEHLSRPLAIDMAHGAAYLGPPASEFEATTGSLIAPDFSLPDLDGKLHSLSDFRGSKVLIAAWASW